MLAAIGVASSVFDALRSLTSSVSSPSQVTTGFTQVATTAFDTASTATGQAGAGTSSSSAPPSGKLSSDTLSALLAALGQQPTATASKSKTDALNDLFSRLDGDGNGQISKAEFESALGAGGTNVAAADRVFGKMDKNGDGSVSAEELATALKGTGGHHGHHHAGGSKGAGGSDANALMRALDGASSTTTTNSDGSTTTSLIYADGSKVTLTSPAASIASATATSSYNFVEQAIQREAQALATSTAASISLSA
jgi:hypothetical protein